MESFFGHMKDELGVRKKTNRSLLDSKQMKEIMEQGILYYNQDRPHSTLGWKSPLEYRQEALYATNIVTPTK
jgi:transposase InsO family protein